MKQKQVYEDQIAQLEEHLHQHQAKVVSAQGSNLMT
jgi:hypothetical protein